MYKFFAWYTSLKPQYENWCLLFIKKCILCILYKLLNVCFKNPLDAMRKLFLCTNGMCKIFKASKDIQNFYMVYDYNLIIIGDLIVNQFLFCTFVDQIWLRKPYTKSHNVKILKFPKILTNSQNHRNSLWKISRIIQKNVGL